MAEALWSSYLFGSFCSEGNAEPALSSAELGVHIMEKLPADGIFGQRVSDGASIDSFHPSLCPIESQAKVHDSFYSNGQMITDYAGAIS
jgi:hypothetical protein